MFRFAPLLLLLLSSCGLIQSTALRHKYEVSMSTDPVLDTIPVVRKLNLMVVPVYINGHPEPLQFIFDTGANVTVVSQRTADRIGLQSDKTLRVGDSQGQSSRIPLVEIDSLRLGNGIYHEIRTVLVDFPEGSVIDCIAPDGILGYSIIRKLQWKFIPEDSVLIGSSTSMTEDMHIQIPMKGWKEPLLSLQIDSVTYHSILFDSGATGGVDLPEEALTYHSPELKLLSEIDGTTQGIYGNVLDTIFTLPYTEVNLEELTLRTNVNFESKKSPKIGMGALGIYSFVIDGPGELLHLDTIPRLPEADRSRFGMVPGIAGDTLLYVASIVEGGPADKAGLQWGQHLQSVNGHTIESLSGIHCSYSEIIVNEVRYAETLSLETIDGEVIVLEREIPAGTQSIGDWRTQRGMKDSRH